MFDDIAILSSSILNSKNARERIATIAKYFYVTNRIATPYRDLMDKIKAKKHLPINPQILTRTEEDMLQNLMSGEKVPFGIYYVDTLFFDTICFSDKTITLINNTLMSISFLIHEIIHSFNPLSENNVNEELKVEYLARVYAKRILKNKFDPNILDKITYNLSQNNYTYTEEKIISSNENTLFKSNRINVNRENAEKWQFHNPFNDIHYNRLW